MLLRMQFIKDSSGIIEAGLAENGIAWPAITGMETVGAELDAQFETNPVVEEVAESAALEEQPAEESAQAIAEVSESADQFIAEESQVSAPAAEDANESTPNRVTFTQLLGIRVYVGVFVVTLLQTLCYNASLI